MAEQKDYFLAVKESFPSDVPPKSVTNDAQASKCSVVIVSSWVILRMVHHLPPGADWHTHKWYMHINISDTHAHESARERTLPHSSPVRPITHRLNNWNCHSCQCQPYCHGRMGTTLYAHARSSICVRTDLFSTTLTWRNDPGRAGCVLVLVCFLYKDDIQTLD